MPDLEHVKEEFDNLDNVDKRWIAICLVIAVAALATAALAGNLIGDVITFVLVFAAGWFVHDQWNVVRVACGRRRTAPRPGTAPAGD